MVSRRNDGGSGEIKEVTEGVASYRAKMQLGDPRLLDVVPEPWWGTPTVVMTTLFPSLIIQQQVNSLSTRQILPVGPGVFDFIWTHFGFADDDPAMQRRRLRQANLFGPAGFVSADDGEVIEFIQQGLSRNREVRTLNEQDGRDVKATPHHDRGWPLALIHLESRAMLQDRITGATDTIFHDPYAQRHVVGAPVLLETSADALRCEAAYLVVRTQRDRMPEVMSVGRYVDRLVRQEGRWLIAERLCIYDNDLIANSLIYPI